jgi:integrative and conjugative element protein (TIGR02256 family)
MADLPRLLVADAVNRSLLAIPFRPWEVGGWLLGYWSADEQTIVVVVATPPSGRGSAFGVTISGRGHGRKFDEAWDASSGSITFLGDWHTHPGGSPRPSTTDCDAMQQLATDPAYGTPVPLIAIVAAPRLACGGRSPETGYLLRTKDGRVHRLEPELTTVVPLLEGLPQWRWPRRRELTRRPERPPLTQ